MNQSPTVFLLPDSSVLVTLANSDKLDILFEPGWTLVLIDSVVHDVVRNTSPCAEILGKWLRKNNLPVVQTRVHERAQKAIRMGLSIPQQMRMQDLGIQEVMNELALDCGGRLGVFLLEEHRFMAASFLEPQNCKKFTLRAFNTFLEQRALSALAARTLDADEAAKQLTVEPAEATTEAAEAPVQAQSSQNQPKKADSKQHQSKHEAVDVHQAEKPTDAQAKPFVSQSVQPEMPVADERVDEPPLAWLDEKKPVIQRKPIASAPQSKAKVGLITGAAIQLLGRKRAEAVEAAFSKLKGTLRLTDSSNKGPQAKKTAPASITPIARQKPVEPPQGSDEQPVAPPKPMAKQKPHDAAEGSNETPRSVTLQKLLEEQAERAKLQPQDKKPVVSKPSVEDTKTEVQSASILPTAPEFPGQAKAAEAAVPDVEAKQTVVRAKGSSQSKESKESKAHAAPVVETTPDAELPGFDAGGKAAEPAKKPVPRAVKQADVPKASEASKVDAVGVQQTLLSDDDLTEADQKKSVSVSGEVEDAKKVELKASKPAARSKKVATARSGKAKEKEQAKAEKRPPSFLLKKENSEAKAPEAKAPEEKEPSVAEQTQKGSEPEKAKIDPQLVKDFKNLIA